MIHRILPAALMALLLLSGVSTMTHAQPAAALRPPAVPLVTHDPYFSVWSFSDHLNADWPKHWTGAINGMTAILRVDGKGYTLMGNPRIEGLTAMTQRSVEVLPTRTIYQFEGAGVGVTLTFLTPALPMDLDVLSRPLTYVTFDTKATDGKSHKVELYFDATGEWAVDKPNQEVMADRLENDKGYIALPGTFLSG